MEMTLDLLAQMMVRGFDEQNQKMDVLTREVFRLGDDVRDLKNVAKTHQQMLMDHERRIDTLELKSI